MLKLSKNIIEDLKSRGVQKVKLYFYNSGCSGTKLDIHEDDFETFGLIQVDLKLDFKVFIEEKDEDKFKNAIITKVEVADHTGNKKTRYLYNSEVVKDRCGCGSSFSFEKKTPKLNLEKLKGLKNNF
nr:hypothetical protein [Candidatus Gracilibacteria bacterium]